MEGTYEKEDSGKAPQLLHDQGWSCHQPRWGPRGTGQALGEVQALVLGVLGWRCLLDITE